MSKIAILDMGLNNIKSIYNLSSKFSETYVFSKRNEFNKNTEMLISTETLGRVWKFLMIRDLQNLLEIYHKR